MQQHAGSPDILDAMMLEFNSEKGAAVDQRSASTRSQNKGANKTVSSRSRIDEYFKTVVVKHDV